MSSQVPGIKFSKPHVPDLPPEHSEMLRASKNPKLLDTARVLGSLQINAKRKAEMEEGLTSA
jgi:hypothetical protein